MRNEENIYQYCTRQRAMTTLSLKCLLKSNAARVILLITSTLLNIIYLVIFLFEYFNTNMLYSLHLFCTRSVEGFLQSIYFGMFLSKHSITFENTYLLSCWFHCVDIFYINYRFCETSTVINSVARIFLIETFSWSNRIPTQLCFSLVLIQMFCIPRLPFLSLTFH